jgi:hypothetical protein
MVAKMDSSVMRGRVAESVVDDDVEVGDVG